MNAVEPVRTIKDRVRFTLRESKELTLQNQQRAVTYKRSDVTLAVIEKQYADYRIAMGKIEKPFTPSDEKKEPKKDGDRKEEVKPVDPLGSTKLYRDRLAELHDAIAKGQVARMKDIVKRYPDILNDRDDKSETPLMKAMQSGYVDIVKELLILGADYKVADRDGNDAFFHAIQIGRYEWLITGLGGTVTSTNFTLRQGNSSGQFHWSNHMLLTRNIKKQNGFMVAAAHGQLNDFKFMYAGGTSYDSARALQALNEKDIDGKTVMEHAQEKGHKHIVAWLEEVSGKKVTVTPMPEVKKGSKKFTPSSDPKQLTFLAACEKGDLEAVDAALQEATKAAPEEGRRSLLSARGAGGRTPLMIAAERGDAAMVLILSKHVRESKQFTLLEAIDTRGWNLFHFAAAGKATPEVLEHLRRLLASAFEQYRDNRINWFQVLHHVDNDGKTPLDVAKAAGNRTEIANAFKGSYQAMFDAITMVPYDTNWDQSGQFARTALEIACMDGDAKTVKQMLQMGYPIDRKSGAKTPLMEASAKGHVFVVQTLLDSFGDDEAKRSEYVQIAVMDASSIASPPGGSLSAILRCRRC